MHLLFLLVISLANGTIPIFPPFFSSTLYVNVITLYGIDLVTGPYVEKVKAHRKRSYIFTNFRNQREVRQRSAIRCVFLLRGTYRVTDFLQPICEERRCEEKKSKLVTKGVLSEVKKKVSQLFVDVTMWGSFPKLTVKSRFCCIVSSFYVYVGKKAKEQRKIISFGEDAIIPTNKGNTRTVRRQFE